MNNNNSSADTATQDLLNVAAAHHYETVWDRAKQQSPKCKIGRDGLCCKNCLLGPCHITARAPRGVCGATADTIVMRNFVRHIAAGTAAHTNHSRSIALMLEKIAEGKTDEYPIHDTQKLRVVAEKLKIPPSDDIYLLAKMVAEKALEDFGSQKLTPLNFLAAYAPAKTITRWRSVKDTDMTPRGIDREISEVFHQTVMGTNHDPLTLLIQGMRTALANGWGASLIATELQDIIFGTPKARSGMTNLGVIDPETVNIIVHGHEPLLADKLATLHKNTEIQDAARRVGAKGLKVYGLCCSGGELLTRHGIPLIGNIQQQELAIITGVIEAFIVDVHCIFPSLAYLARNFHTQFISTSEHAIFPGSQHIPFREEKASAIANNIIQQALDAYPKRDETKINLTPHKTEAIVGFSVESLKKTFGGSLALLADALKTKEIKGIVCMMGCNSTEVKHDAYHIALTQALIKKGFLIVGTGCWGAAAAKAGLMQCSAAEQAATPLKKFCQQYQIPPVLHLGSCVDSSRFLVLAAELAKHFDCDIADLPLFASAPEWMSEKALAISLYFVASGINMHLWPTPPISGSEEITRLLTEELTNIIGARYFIEENPERAAEIMIRHLPALLS